MMHHSTLCDLNGNIGEMEFETIMRRQLLQFTQVITFFVLITNCLCFKIQLQRKSYYNCDCISRQGPFSVRYSLVRERMERFPPFKFSSKPIPVFSSPFYPNRGHTCCMRDFHRNSRDYIWSPLHFQTFSRMKAKKQSKFRDLAKGISIMMMLSIKTVEPRCRS